MNRNTRIWGTGVVALAGLLLLSLAVFTPSSEAEVYQLVGQRLGTLAQLVGASPQPGGRRSYLINGQRIDAELSVAAEPATMVITRLQAVSSVASNDLAARRPKLRRFDAATWSALVHFSLGPGEDVTMPRLDRVVLAVDKAGQDGATALWMMNFGPETDLSRLLDEPDRDGLDALPLAGVEWFPGSVPMFQLSEFSSFSEGHVVVFKGGGSPRSHMRHFIRGIHSRLAGAKLRVTGDEKYALAYVDDGPRELTIYSAFAEAGGGEVIDIVQVGMRR